MIRVHIGQAKKKFETIDGIDKKWIAQQIRRRRTDKLTVCVKVYIKVRNVDIVLSTPTCPVSGGGGRKPRKRENEIFQLWEDRGLKNENYTIGNLISFFQQLRKYL